jgi:uncharacterized protein (DUF427 family)
MGLSWQQGPLAPGSIGTFLVAEPLPARLLYAEPLRRRMRVTFAGTRIAESDDVVLLHEPGRYPVAYFPKADVVGDMLAPTDRTSIHPELGATTWYAVKAGDREARRGAWEHTALPEHAAIFTDRVAFAWHAMDAFYEEDERILGHAADAYHRIDIRTTSRKLVVRAGETVIAESHRPLVLYESGFAPRWYVPREDVNQELLRPSTRETFCPYKGICSYYDIGDANQAAWAYREPYREVDRIGDLISFEPDKVSITLDGEELRLEPGQHVVAHGPDRGLDVDEVRAVAAPTVAAPTVAAPTVPAPTTAT